MAVENQQVIYGFSGSSEPVKITVGDDDHSLVKHSDFTDAMERTEDAFGQKIIQDNSETQRINSLIAGQGLATELDPGTATLADVIAQINGLLNIQNNFVVQQK